MKSPKEKIAVGVLLLGATVGLSGCVPKDHTMYTAYGVVAPVQSILKEHAEKAAEGEATVDASTEEATTDDGANTES